MSPVIPRNQPLYSCLNLPALTHPLFLHRCITSCAGMCVQDTDEALSLKDAYMNHCAAVHDDPTWLVQHVHRYLHPSSSVNHNDNSDNNEKEGISNNHSNDHSNNHQQPQPPLHQGRWTRHHRAYKEACSLVPSTLLRDLFLAHSATAFTAWSARREFASQLGLLAALQCLLDARGLGPDQLVVHPSTGTLVTAGMTPHIPSSSPSLRGTSTNHNDHHEGEGNEGDVSEDPRPPFRLTRNMVGALSGALLLGVTTVNIGVSLDAYLANQDVVEVYLSMLLLETMRTRGARQRREQGQRQRRSQEPGLLLLQPSDLEAISDVGQVDLP